MAYDANGKECWRKQLTDPIDPYWTERWAWFGDLDNDGRGEVVLIQYPAQHADGPDILFAIQTTGRNSGDGFPVGLLRLPRRSFFLRSVSSASPSLTFGLVNRSGLLFQRAITSGGRTKSPCYRRKVS